MNGERAMKIYACAVLKADPKITDEEERAYYNAIRKEMREKEAKAKKENRRVEWGVPSE